MDFLLMTLGFGLLIGSTAEAKMMLEGSPLMHGPTLSPVFFLGTLLSLAGLVAGFLVLGWWWIVGVLIAWLPLNYYVGNLLRLGSMRYSGTHLGIVAGAALMVFVVSGH